MPDNSNPTELNEWLSVHPETEWTSQDAQEYQRLIEKQGRENLLKMAMGNHRN